MKYKLIPPFGWRVLEWLIVLATLGFLYVILTSKACPALAVLGPATDQSRVCSLSLDSSVLVELGGGPRDPRQLFEVTP